ncbi:hypothetical protein CPLU01_05160 [Colletotrichum plurivorum]|uniref:Uncharacterized protein n=1 Tax=Colletotrichum plurivorum TaxID=2175906 RepID=A0A8H6KM48_9PEZI|nr:hypothetical protein CPLU01_05160 [Colletotrichum plurivorum]
MSHDLDATFNAGSSDGPAKKSKTAAAAPPADEAAGEASTASPSSIFNETRWSTKNDRYSAVSNSRNTDVDYKKAMKDPEFAFTYICKCPWGTKRDGDEEDGAEKPKCDLGKTCLCDKLAADHPEAPYVITRAAYHKLMNQQVKSQVRNPDSFDMHTFNDHAAYGSLQVLQNLILDFEEAEGCWKEQWVVCEALAPLIWYLQLGSEFGMIDDGESAMKTAKLVGNMFLAMLARLEREGVLKPDSEVKDLGFVMAGFLKVAESFRDCSLLEDEDKVRNYVAAYAKKHGIKLGGVPKLDELLAGVDDKEKLPTPEEHGDDPWGFAAALEEYKKGGNSCDFFVPKHSSKSAIGGDSLDITSWTPAERKKASFNKKDPLPKNILDGIKDGLVIGLG